MKFSVLASGSSGNALYIETDNTRLLVDAGLSGKQLGGRLAQIGVNPESLTAILVTHEHIDHVKGLGVMARRYQLPIYLNEATYQHLPSSVGDIPTSMLHFMDTGSSISIADIGVQSIPISHDAAEPMGFRFFEKDESMAIVTDLGYVNERIIQSLDGVHSLIWESNHDVNMLRMGSYPWNVKRRILGDTGHLSNEDSAIGLLEIIKGLGEQVYLAHLSQDNNLLELAHLTVKNMLEEAGLQVGKDIVLKETYPDRPTPLQNVKMQSAIVSA
ncbi:MBL fold metallo-hydrolase [Shimazuella sp. AN120528]|uniref:MBL fold metallo-hydrolase n=1 Tax=Shimazuella soli TaxID=1892854 RepID=UPI001F116230|nr:MBL fold metallo-hydrolase [Shimazuella soli]